MATRQTLAKTIRGKILLCNRSMGLICDSIKRPVDKNFTVCKLDFNECFFRFNGRISLCELTKSCDATVLCLPTPLDQLRDVNTVLNSELGVALKAMPRILHCRTAIVAKTVGTMWRALSQRLEV